MYKRPIFKLQTNDFVLKGITAQPTKLKKSVKNGANINKKWFALFGTTISLTINFKASANGWRTPQNPVMLGPRLRWIAPITLRSARVKKATDIIKKINVNNDKIKNTQ